MKARIKATGEIVEVTRIVDRYVMTHHPHAITFEKDELDFDIEDDPDYWTRLEHQYAGMAMQGMCANHGWDNCTWSVIANDAYEAAHALVEKYKKEK